MAIPRIKSTYALDLETVRTLEAVARRWGVSKSEALRRAIRAAAGGTSLQSDPLTALRELQRSLGLKVPEADAWARQVRGERRAASVRRTRRRR